MANLCYKTVQTMLILWLLPVHLCVTCSNLSREVNIQMFVLTILSRVVVIIEDPAVTAIII